jgi:peptidyl-prolyl cis-trans isomerase SurA
MVAFRWVCAVLVAAAAWSGTPSTAQTRGREAATRSGAPAPQTQPAQEPQGKPGEGHAAPEIRIAAVVNDEVISIFDLISRMRLVMASSNIPDSPETRQRLGAQVLKGLIDEKLELQEAKRQSITASDSEINNALLLIEKQNNMRPGQLNDFLKARGIDRGGLVDQLTASIVWAKLVRRLAAQSVEISDEEIEEQLKRTKERAGEPQSRVAEIFLAVDSPAQDEEIRRLAERLSQQMKQGSRFSAIAQQFSQSATAAVGGDIGWVRPDQLAPELAKAVSAMRPGELSAPIRSGGGYYLVLVVDRRSGGGGEAETVYDIVQVVFPLPGQASDAARRAAVSEAMSVRAAAKDCPGLLKIGKEKAPQLSSEGKLRASNISPEMHNVVDKLAVGQASEPIVQKNGVGIIMICGKSDSGSATSRDKIADLLLRQRLDTVARRYLRDLRRNAYVDVRV